jgi:hypothetical protein
VDSSHAYVRDYGPGNLKITDKTVTTITEYFWNFEVGALSFGEILLCFDGEQIV